MITGCSIPTLFFGARGALYIMWDHVDQTIAVVKDEAYKFSVHFFRLSCCRAQLSTDNSNLNVRFRRRPSLVDRVF